MVEKGRVGPLCHRTPRGGRSPGSAARTEVLLLPLPSAGPAAALRGPGDLASILSAAALVSAGLTWAGESPQLPAGHSPLLQGPTQPKWRPQRPHWAALGPSLSPWPLAQAFTMGSPAGGRWGSVFLGASSRAGRCLLPSRHEPTRFLPDLEGFTGCAGVLAGGQHGAGRGWGERQDSGCHWGVRVEGAERS